MLTTPTLQAIPVAPSSARRLGWEIIALAVVAAIAHLPLLVQHATWLWQRPYYQFFPLVLIGAGVLAYTRMRSVLLWHPGNSIPTLAGLIASMCLLGAADLLTSPWLGCVATMVLLMTLVYAAGGRELCREALPAWVLLWLVVPPPLDFDRLLIFKLQNLTTAWSSAVLDVFGVFHVRSGNVIEVGDKKMMVEQACSGVNSLFSVLSFTLFLIFLTRRGWGRGILLVLAAVAWVLLANVARVTGVVLLDTRWGLNVSSGWRHEMIGLLLFAAAIALLLSTDQFFAFLTRSVPQAPDDRKTTPSLETAPEVSRMLTRGMRRVAAVSIAAYLVLAIVSWTALTPARETLTEHLTAPEKESLSTKIGAWEQTEFAIQTREANSFFGEQSSVWKYATARQGTIVAVDFPFPGWHDLTWCYTAKGWHIDSQTIRTDCGVEGGFLEVQMSLPTHRFGYLLFREFDNRGQPLVARPCGLEASSFRHQKAIQRARAWLGLDREPVVDPNGSVYQFQLFWEGYDRLPPEDEAAMVELFARSGDEMKYRLTPKSGKQ